MGVYPKDENNNILQEATIQEMHCQHFTYDTRINGVCYGFYEGSLNNQRIIEHRGAIGSFNSYLVLLPEQNVGLFISSNSAGGIKANDIIKQEFLDRYYPLPDSSAQQLPTDFQQRAKLFTGSYGTTRSPYTTYEKLLGLMGGINIKATEDHLLINSKQFVEVRQQGSH
jgi:CubicO group peptidase (beta-lactamase class C family)